MLREGTTTTTMKVIDDIDILKPSFTVVDCSQAFDTADHDTLFGCLTDIGFPQQAVWWVANNNLFFPESELNQERKLLGFL